MDALRPQIAVQGEGHIGAGNRAALWILLIGIHPDLGGGIRGLTAPDQRQGAFVVHGGGFVARVGDAGVVVQDAVPVVLVQRVVFARQTFGQLPAGQPAVSDGLTLAGVIRCLRQIVGDGGAVDAVFPQAGDGDLSVFIAGVQAVFQHIRQSILIVGAIGHPVIVPVEGEVLQKGLYFRVVQFPRDTLLHVQRDGEILQPDKVPAGVLHAVHAAGILNILEGIIAAGDGVGRLQGPGDGVAPIHGSVGVLLLQLRGQAVLARGRDAEDAGVWVIGDRGHIRQPHDVQIVLGQLLTGEGGEHISVFIDLRQRKVQLRGHGSFAGVTQFGTPSRAVAAVVVIGPVDLLGLLLIVRAHHGPVALAGEILPGGDGHGGGAGGGLIILRADGEGDAAADRVRGPGEFFNVEGQEDLMERNRRRFKFCFWNRNCKGKTVVRCVRQKGTVCQRKTFGKLQRCNDSFATLNVERSCRCFVPALLS